VKVDIVDYTENPEDTMAKAARNDYSDMYIGDLGFEEIMEPVDYDEDDLDWVKDELDDPDHDYETEAKKKSFIEGLLSREHYGPAEHAHAAVSIEGVSRSLMAQFTRHRHMSFDVQSMRYVDFEDADSIVPETLRDDSQHLSREEGLVDLDQHIRDKHRERYKELMDRLTEFYSEAVDDGVPKEDARFAMPLGTPVNMVASGNLRSWMHVLNVRQKADAQWEIRELSNEITEELGDVAPITVNYFEENGPFKLGL
jgi:thymidylate synthase (FAD)